MNDPTPAPPGFQMSTRRALTEILLIVSVLGGGIALVMWLAGRAALVLTDSVPVSVDETIGEQSSRVVQATSTPCSRPEATRYVNDIADPLVRALADPRFTFRFVVVDSLEVNAFALPGGFVTVNSGLLEAAESGEEVAAVLAHELTHVVRRHGTQRMLRELGATTVLSALFGATSVAVPARVTHDFLSNAYDRDQEREADSGGLALLKSAGIDPGGMATFFRRLSKTGVAPPAWLSTHPDPGDRAESAARAAKGARVTVHLPSPMTVHCR